MAKINFIIFCNDVKQEANKNLNAMGIFDTIVAEKFPAVHKQMFVVVNFDISSGPHKEFFKISRNGEAVLTSEEFDFNVPGDKHQFIHRIDGLNLPEPGKYKVEIFIDGKLEGDNYFLVGNKQKINYA